MGSYDGSAHGFHVTKEKTVIGTGHLLMGAERQLSAHTPGTCGPRGANRGEEMGRQLNSLELEREQLPHFKRYIISL